MATFKDIIKLPSGSKAILMGNRAFAAGVIHAGICSANGYPGTPSTEVIDTLIQVPDFISAGWSVNEAVSIGAAIGVATAGKDALATMKVPGVFQAADVLVSGAFAEMYTGALILYVATDNEPSSSQFLMDVRPFLHSIHVPIIEPRNHQELYESPKIAAEISRREKCPVVILTSSILAHSESIITIGQKNTPVVTPEFSGNNIDVIPLPAFARKVHDKIVLNRMKGVREYTSNKTLTSTSQGKENWGIICVGYTDSLVKDVLNEMNSTPHVFSLSLSNPLPINEIKLFRESFSGECFIIEEAAVFVEQQLKINDISVIGKANNPTITHWTPLLIKQYLEAKGQSLSSTNAIAVPFVKRPPAICVGCNYRAIATAIQDFKKKGIITKVFGDIGCSSLLSFEGVFDYSLCMGASESLRQGYVEAKPESCSKVLSLIGDSSECHSGMDASRNSVYRNIPGVKVILDNSAVAMTGYQPSPTSNSSSSISLKAALEGEKIPAVEVDAYDIKAIKQSLTSALKKAEEGIFSAIIIKGSCLHILPKKKDKILELDKELCISCGLCNVCPAISLDSSNSPVISKDCTLCGSGTPLCISACPKDAIKLIDIVKPEKAISTKSESKEVSSFNKEDFNGIFRLGVRGVGGQGNLFIGKVLALVVQQYFRNFGNIYKGEVHGMAQMGGPVVSTFSFGNVHSPLCPEKGLDVILSLERTELLRQNFTSFLKPGGHIILSERAIIPREYSQNDYPTLDAVLNELKSFNTTVISIPTEYKAIENIFMLGVLSNYAPFKNIPDELWRSVLGSLSKTDAIAQINMESFLNGKNYKR